ncbi:MAG TPA: hypothetical protein VK509_10050 [Polyangiales bacterium]|nr:hypothetical protein [Polyangiales bacterium]
MTYQRRLRAVALLCVLPLLTLFAVPLASCAGLMPLVPLIHDVATVVADVTGALDAAESVARQPGVDPELAARALDLIAKARQANDVVRAAAKTAELATDRDYAAAVAELLRTYDAVTALLRDLGLRQAPLQVRSRLGAAPAGTRLVPTTEEIRAGLLRPERGR